MWHARFIPIFTSSRAQNCGLERRCWPDFELDIGHSSFDQWRWPLTTKGRRLLFWFLPPSPPPEELGALFSKMVKLCDVEPNRLSTDNWKGLSGGINLGIDLLQIFSRFFLCHESCGKGHKRLSKTSCWTITVKGLTITISSTSRGQILMHFPCVTVTVIYPAHANINDNTEDSNQ